jgi:hypothetical protein
MFTEGQFKVTYGNYSEVLDCDEVIGYLVGLVMSGEESDAVVLSMCAMPEAEILAALPLGVVIETI